MVIVAVAATVVKSRGTRRALIALAAVAPVIIATWVIAGLLLGLLFLAGPPPDPTATALGGCGVAAPTAQARTSLAPAQLANAATIIAVGRQLGIPAFGLQVGIATALQESRLLNLAHGDGTSVGLFQQINSWGSFAQRHDPTWAARKFFGALKGVAGWATMPLTVAAQAVQRSAFPQAYAKWTSLAASVVHLPALAGSTCTGTAGFPVVARNGSLPARQAALIVFGHRLQALGFTVGEHPAFGGVHPVHAPHSFHYIPGGGAIDVNYDGHATPEKTKLDTLIPLAKAAGFRIIWQFPGHFDHMHIDVSTGPDMGHF